FLHLPLLPPSFFDPPSTSEFYTLSLHDALPISFLNTASAVPSALIPSISILSEPIIKSTCTILSLISFLSSSSSLISSPFSTVVDRKSTRLNSSHVSISYAVFCLKKKREKYYLK